MSLKRHWKNNFIIHRISINDVKLYSLPFYTSHRLLIIYEVKMTEYLITYPLLQMGALPWFKQYTALSEAIIISS